MTKTCPQCKQSKDSSEYHRSNTRKDGVSSWCKKCESKKARERRTPELKKKYRENDEANRIERKKALRKIADEAKGPCVDCGRVYHPCAMDFHHIDSEDKDMEISKMIGMGASQERLRAEIAKCEVLCAICHRIRHFKKTNLEVV
jgi:hypothetical protein